MKRALALALIAVPAWLVAPRPPAALSDDAWTVKLDFKAGERWREEELSDRTGTMRLTLPNGQAYTLEVVEHEERVSTKEVLAATGPTVTEIRAAFEKVVTNTRKTITAGPQGAQAPEEETTVGAYAGKTVTLSRSPSGAISFEPADVAGDPKVREELEQDLVFESFFPADKAVKPGDRWIVDESAVKSTFKIGEKDRGTVRCKFKEVVEVGGRKCARLEVGITLKKIEEEDGIPIESTLDLEGEAVFTLPDAKAVTIDLEGPMTAKGERPVQGGNMVIQLEGSLKYSQKNEWGAGAGGGGAGGMLGGAGLGGGSGSGSGSGAGTDAGPGVDVSTPEKLFAALFDALRAGDFALFQKLHTPEIRVQITKEAFDATREKLARAGAPTLEAAVPQEDGSVELKLTNGKHLTSAVKVGAHWLAARVWTKAPAPAPPGG